MNRLALSLPAMAVAFAMAAAPVAQAQSVTKLFKDEIVKAIGTKKGKAAAKAATKTIAKYVVAKPKGDPAKFASFTSFAIKKLKGLNADADFVVEWSNKPVKDYFKKGIKTTNVNDSKFKAALKKAYKLAQKNQPLAQKGFDKLKKTTKVTGSDLESLANEVSKITKVTIES
mgnify:CR=1 FL=1